METTWKIPTELPDLKPWANLISLDCETYDPHLEEDGPGGVRGEGHVVGLSLATDTGFAGYFPLYHAGGGNCENPERVIEWVRDQLGTDTPKTGANLLYDLEWLKCDPKFRIDVRGPKWDVQVADPLLDETLSSYTLNDIAKRRIGKSKDETEMIRAAVELLGLNPKAKDLSKLVKKNLWRLPGTFVGRYGETDATLPIEVIQKQTELLKIDGVWELFRDVESPLIDLLLLMRLQGVPVDVPYAERTAEELSGMLLKTQKQLCRRVGRDVDIWSGDDLAAAADKLGLRYPRTGKGNPSFQAKWLEESDHEFFQLVLQARQLDRGGSVYVTNKILKLLVNGRVHPQFWQVKTDKYGTESGRFSSSNPNVQQIPSRNPVIGPMIRRCFKPDDGRRWGVFDYKQQEPIVMLHYAYLCGFPGAAEGRKKYIEDVKTDYHQWTADMANIERKPAKTINLGLSYGMGDEKLAISLGISLAEAKDLKRRYFRGLPYVRAMMNRCSDLVDHRGWIKTYLGRRRHFNKYGPGKWDKKAVPLPRDEALKKYGPPIRRWGLHKALNSLIQGTSADMTKLSMLQIWKEYGYVPYLTVHDEHDFPIESYDQARKIRDDQVRKIRDVMRTCMKLEVPIRVDVELGDSWGEVREVEL